MHCDHGLDCRAFALVLADRFNQERKAKSQAQWALVEGLRQSERELELKVAQRTEELGREQTRTKELLHNILPVKIAEELATYGSAKPVRHESATLLFTDFKGFTQAVSTMPADDFFIGPMLTAVMPGDCVTAVHFPIWRHARLGTGFHEVSARQSDFAFVAAAAQVALDGNGQCVDAALGIGGVGDRAVRLDVSGLIGGSLDKASIVDMVREATQVLEPTSDLHASAEYRMRVAVTLGVRALEDAIKDAQLGNDHAAHGGAQ